MFPERSITINLIGHQFISTLDSTGDATPLGNILTDKERDKRLLEKQASTVGADVLEIERRLGATIGGIASKHIQLIIHH